MIYRDIIQGTDEWDEIKRGKVSSTKVKDILPGANGKYKESRVKLMGVLAREIITGVTVKKRTSKSMDDGLDKEPFARAAYEAQTGYLVEEVGFVTHPTIEGFGVSPDGLIDDYDGIEIKCPEAAAHFDIVVRGIAAVKKEYIIQMNAQMICCEAFRWHYVDYDPDLPEELGLMIILIQKDKELCKQIEMEVIKFIAELNEMVKKLKEIKK